jgi:recombination protein RecT
MTDTINESQLAPPAANNGKVRDLIASNRFKSAVAAALPAHLRPERFVRVALTALTRTPRLAECDQASLFQALLTLSQLGLEPDGRNAHLIPFRNSKRNVTECQLIVDYKGLVALAIRSGRIAKIHADKVCENDLFSYDRGEIMRHQINFRAPRGAPYAYYAIVRFKDGTEQSDVMTKAEVEAIRARSRAAQAGPWVTDFDEMAKKTVFRRLTKWLELSPEYRDALDADADVLEERRFESALPIERPVIRTLPAAASRVELSRRKRKSKSLEPKEATDAPPEEEHPYADKLVADLASANYTQADFIELAITEGWIKEPAEHINQIPEQRCKAFLDSFAVVAEKLDARGTVPTTSEEQPNLALTKDNPFQ